MPLHYYGQGGEANHDTRMGDVAISHAAHVTQADTINLTYFQIQPRDGRNYGPEHITSNRIVLNAKKRDP